MLTFCDKHGTTKHYERRRGVSFRCGKCAYEAVKKRRWEIKKKLVDHAGGKCIKCGYNKSLSALTFHHRDPEQKTFQIAKNYNAMTFELLVDEVNKCDLLCANCHQELWEES